MQKFVKNTKNEKKKKKYYNAHRASTVIKQSLIITHVKRSANHNRVYIILKATVEKQPVLFKGKERNVKAVLM